MADTLDGIALADVENYARLIEGRHGPTAILTWHTLLNGFEPWDRRSQQATGYAIRYIWQPNPLPGAPNQGPYPPEVRITLMGHSLRKLGECVWLIDDGKGVWPYYGGPARDVRERGADGHPVQHLARVNPRDSEGGRFPNPEIDPHMILSPVTPLEGWLLTPRKAYHVKVRPTWPIESTLSALSDYASQ